MCIILTWPQADGDLLRHNLDDIVLGRPGPFRAQGHALHDRNAAGGVLNEPRLAAPLLQVLTKIAP